MVVFALFGVIFGGLHCIGWDFKFPTHTEQTFWRSTSLAIAAIPLIAAPIDLLLATRLRIRDINSCPTTEKVTLLILDLVMTLLLFVYVPARLSLIAQALALLRSQPPSALAAVDWTKYLPHLFSSWFFGVASWISLLYISLFPATQLIKFYNQEPILGLQSSYLKYCTMIDWLFMSLTNYFPYVLPYFRGGGKDSRKLQGFIQCTVQAFCYNIAT